MKRREEKRTNSFLWESRQELYDYFSATYEMTKERVDEAIESAKKEFTIRQGTTIDTRDLWQKVGMVLEKKCGGIRKKSDKPAPAV